MFPSLDMLCRLRGIRDNLPVLTLGKFTHCRPDHEIQNRRFCGGFVLRDYVCHTALRGAVAR